VPENKNVREEYKIESVTKVHIEALTQLYGPSEFCRTARLSHWTDQTLVTF
jgi:hypothetical protein